MADALAALAVDLRELPAADRRAVLGALTAAERARLKLLLNPRAEPASVAAERFDIFSPWLAARLRGEPGGSWSMTPAASGLLQEAAFDVLRANGSRDPAPRGASLLGALRTWLLTGRAA